MRGVSDALLSAIRLAEQNAYKRLIVWKAERYKGR